MKNPFKREKKTEEPEGRYVRLPDGFPEEITDVMVDDLLHIGTAVMQKVLESPADAVAVVFDTEGREHVGFHVHVVAGVFEQTRP